MSCLLLLLLWAVAVAHRPAVGVAVTSLSKPLPALGWTFCPIQSDIPYPKTTVSLFLGLGRRGPCPQPPTNQQCTSLSWSFRWMVGRLEGGLALTSTFLDVDVNVCITTNKVCIYSSLKTGLSLSIHAIASHFTWTTLHVYPYTILITESHGLLLTLPRQTGTPL